MDHLKKNGAKGRKGTFGLLSSGYSDGLLVPALGALGSEQISFSSNTSVSAASSLAQGVVCATSDQKLHRFFPKIKIAKHIPPSCSKVLVKQPTPSLPLTFQLEMIRKQWIKES